MFYLSFGQWGLKMKIANLVLFGSLLFGVSSADVLADDPVLLPKSEALLARELPARHNECENCHRRTKISYVTKLKKLRREHTDITSLHGDKKLNCTYCHDNKKNQYLKEYPGIKVSFTSSSGVCSQCHSQIFKDWKLGIHGKTVESWKREGKLITQCITCHDPHNVSFKKMMADPPPPLPKGLIPKEH